MTEHKYTSGELLRCLWAASYLYPSMFAVFWTFDLARQLTRNQFLWLDAETRWISWFEAQHEKYWPWQVINKGDDLR